MHTEVMMEDGDTQTRPPKPEAPLDSDCCGNGCSPCVFDLYEEELRVWERECQGIAGTPTADSSRAALSETEYRAFHVSSIQKEGANSFIFRVDLPQGQHLGLDTGQHVIVRMCEAQTAVTRQFTPVSPPRTPGYFELLIKIYPDGRMSKHLSKLKPGDSLYIRGPGGGFCYKPNQWQCMYLFAAGTGIAPMAQVIQQVLSNEDDDTRLCLLYTCARYEELLLKQRLDEWAGFWNLSITYFLTQDNAARVTSMKRYGDHIEYGRIQLEHLSSVLANRPPRFQVLICGTLDFDRDMISYLSSISVSCDNYHKF